MIAGVQECVLRYANESDVGVNRCKAARGRRGSGCRRKKRESGCMRVGGGYLASGERVLQKARRCAEPGRVRQGFRTGRRRELVGRGKAKKTAGTANETSNSRSQGVEWAEDEATWLEGRVDGERGVRALEAEGSRPQESSQPALATRWQPHGPALGTDLISPRPEIAASTAADAL